MKELPVVEDCKTREEMLTQVSLVMDAVKDLIKEIPDDMLQARAHPEGWTVAKNVAHVCSSVKSFGYWSGAPPWFLKLMGKPAHPEHGVADIKATNRPLHFDYGTYPKPGPLKAGLKDKLVEDIQNSESRVRALIEKRSEEELDGFRGLFGGITLRVFILFMLKHMLYHMGVVRSRFVAKN